MDNCKYTKFNQLYLLFKCLLKISKYKLPVLQNAGAIGLQLSKYCSFHFTPGQYNTKSVKTQSVHLESRRLWISFTWCKWQWQVQLRSKNETTTKKQMVSFHIFGCATDTPITTGSVRRYTCSPIGLHRQLSYSKMEQEEGLLCLLAQSREHRGDSRRPPVMQESWTELWKSNNPAAGPVSAFLCKEGQKKNCSSHKMTFSKLLVCMFLTKWTEMDSDTTSTATGSGRRFPGTSPID